MKNWMKHSLLFHLVLFVVIFGSVSIALADVNSSFESIKHVQRYYGDPGAVCEEVARDEMLQRFPRPDYEIYVGVSYSENGRTIGELDMVVYDNQSRKVVMVGEVKCYAKLPDGLRKAKEQRQRFFEHLNNPRNQIDFVLTSTRQRMPQELFKGLTSFISISQKGGAAVGFDYEMSLNLSEMHALSEKLIQCQQRGECPQPF